MAQVDRDLQCTMQALVEGRAGWPLYLFGSPGTGKSRAALCLCDIAPTACYWTAEELAGYVLRTDANEVEATWATITEKHLAVLDELGTRERTGDLAYVAAFRFAEVRDDKPAVFISNVVPDDLARLYDDRLASRLLCGTVFELRADDRRFSA